MVFESWIYLRHFTTAQYDTALLKHLLLLARPAITTTRTSTTESPSISRFSSGSRWLRYATFGNVGSISASRYIRAHGPQDSADESVGATGKGLRKLPARKTTYNTSVQAPSRRLLVYIYLGRCLGRPGWEDDRSCWFCLFLFFLACWVTYGPGARKTPRPLFHSSSSPPKGG